MCSRKSLQLLALGNDLTYGMFLVPFRIRLPRAAGKYDPTPASATLERCSPRRELLFRLWATTYVTLISLLVYGVGGVYDLTHDIKLSIHARFYFVCTVGALCLSLALQLLTRLEDVYQMEVGLYGFVSKLNKFHQVSPTARDGIEWVLLAYIMNTVGLVLCAPLVILIWIHLGDHMARLFQSDYTIVMVFWAVFSAYGCLFVWLMLFHFFGMAILYMNANRVALSRMKWSPDAPMNKHRRKQFVLMYRAHQVLCNQLVYSFRQLMGFVVASSAFIQIMSLYIIIGLHDQAGTFFLAMVVAIEVAAFVLGKMGLEGIGQVAELSAEFSDSFLRNEFRLSRAERMSFKASRPTRVEIGSVAHISRSTFATLMSVVVVDNVVNLLMM